MCNYHQTAEVCWLSLTVHILDNIIFLAAFFKGVHSDKKVFASYLIGGEVGAGAIFKGKNLLPLVVPFQKGFICERTNSNQPEWSPFEKLSAESVSL